ncbi:molybdenum cofactor guanylyltransferase [Salipaludibacillus sp. HK11]|uniref:molybdenum cofactor guanylyltransferase n=1 Tax=Salipaludibacillus sp. HK11 TaxID=3394320 RepID=UPI0039FCED26
MIRLTGILLAGGKSSRMGRNKALLLIDGQKNITRLKEKVGRVTEELYLVSNDPKSYEFLQLPIVEDKQKNQGPLAGIEAGLKNGNSAWKLVVACDLPFFNAKVVEVLVEKAKLHPNAQAVVPIIHGRQHPLFALYHQSALATVKECLDEGERKMTVVLSNLKVEAVSVEEFLHAGMTIDEIELAFFNMNRPEDYEWAISQIHNLQGDKEEK